MNSMPVSAALLLFFLELMLCACGFGDLNDHGANDNLSPSAVQSSTTSAKVATDFERPRSGRSDRQNATAGRPHASFRLELLASRVLSVRDSDAIAPQHSYRLGLRLASTGHGGCHQHQRCRRGHRLRHQRHHRCRTRRCRCLRTTIG